jgi:hypothetical protein
MKDRDKSKSDVIEKVVLEKEELKHKIYELQYVLTSLLHPTAPPHTSPDTSQNPDSTASHTDLAESAEEMNKSFKLKLTQALDTVKQVSGSISPPVELKYSNCACCTGKLLLV